VIPQCLETALPLKPFVPFPYPTGLPRNARIRTGVVPLRKGTQNKTILKTGPGAGQPDHAPPPNHGDAVPCAVNVLPVQDLRGKGAWHD
jgi:hypothetical protein